MKWQNVSSQIAIIFNEIRERVHAYLPIKCSAGNMNHLTFAQHHLSPISNRRFHLLDDSAWVAGWLSMAPGPGPWPWHFDSVSFSRDISWLVVTYGAMT